MKFKLITIAMMAAVGLGRSQDVNSAARLEFEVASIKPDPIPYNQITVGKPAGGGFWARGIFTKFLIALAYDVKEFQILDAPRGSAANSTPSKQSREIIQKARFFRSI